MEAFSQREDARDGMVLVQQLLSTMKDEEMFFSNPIILKLTDGEPPEVVKDLEDSNVMGKIRKHFDNKEACVYCVMNTTELLVLPVGEDIPLQ